MVIFEPQEGLAAWLCPKIKLVPTRNLVCMGNWSINQQKLIGVVGYDDWTERSVEMHMAGEPGWITREFLWKAFTYPFVHGGVNVVIGKVDSSNQRAIRLNSKLGFKIVGRVPDAFPNGDMLIMAMKRDECRWLDLKLSKIKEVA